MTAILRSFADTRNLEIKQALFELTNSFRTDRRLGQDQELIAKLGTTRKLVESNRANDFLKPYLDAAMEHVTRYETIFNLAA